MTQLIGRRLGRYLITEELGRGGMARVYRAEDTQLQRAVALKILAPQLAVDEEFTRRFEREAVMVANLRHPAIVTIHDVGEIDGLRYIAMEFINGRTLHAVLRERGALGLALTVSIISPIADALDHAHRAGAVHRDVKPQNVMIDIEGRVLLTDFGIAQAPEHHDGERLTRTGMFMGTPEYISPEQASAQRVDGRSDIYSLGIAAYESITGTVPFVGATPQLIVAHVQTPPPPPSKIDPAHPAALDAVFARVLAKHPDDRYPNGAAFVAALRRVARAVGEEPVSSQDLADLARARPRAATAARQTPPPVRASTAAAPTARSIPGQASPRPASSFRPAAPRTPPRPITVPPRTVPWRVVGPAGATIAIVTGALLAAMMGAPTTGGAPPGFPTAAVTGGSQFLPSPLPPSATPTQTLVPTAVPTLAPLPTPQPLPTAEPLPTPLPATAAPPTTAPATAVPPTRLPATAAPATALPVTAAPATALPATAAAATETPQATTPTLAVTETPVPPTLLPTSPPPPTETAGPSPTPDILPTPPPVGG